MMSTSTFWLALALTSWPGGGQADTVRLDGLASTAPGDGLPSGWELRAVRGEEAPVARLITLAGSVVLELRARRGAGQCWKELDEPISPSPGRLAWRWRVAEHLEGVDLRDPALDDAPARLLVVFGRGGLFSRPRMLFYTWGGPETLNDAFPSHVSDRLGVIVVRNAMSEVGVWHDESRDVFGDYRAAFGEEPPEITAVGMMVDTDQLGGTGAVALASLAWIEGT